MAEWILKVAEMDPDMTEEERNLFSVAYKNVIGEKMSAWKIITWLEQKEIDSKTNNGAKSLKYLVEYRKIIEAEMKQVYNRVFNFLKDVTDRPDCIRSVDLKLFYYKLQGDYKRYLAEVSTGDEKETASELSIQAYTSATVVTKELDYPIRLGQALSYAVFYYEVLKLPEKVCKLAKNAMDCAVADLDNLNEEKYKDCTLLMQLLKDKLTLWTADFEGQSDIGDMRDKLTLDLRP